MTPELLGEVTCPSGTVIVVDLGLLGMWSHDEAPLLSEWMAAPETVAIANAARDYRVEGPDAAAAGAVFGAAPGWLYDRSADFEQTFAAAMAARSLDARIVPAATRVPHRERARHALAGGRDVGVVEFHGIWAPIVAGLPPDASLPVFGTRMGGGDFSDRWRQIELVVLDAPVARTEQVGEVMVDWARLAFVDVDSLAAWRHDEPLDGQADFVFWGRDAADVASEQSAPALGDEQYGWLDLAVGEAVERGTKVEELCQARGLKLATDFRPHSHHYQIMAKVRAAPTESGTLVVGGAKLCAFMTSWGDGMFPVEVDRTESGAVATVRIVLATERTLENMRAVN